MAQSSKLVSAFVVNRISFLISRRGYAAATSQGQSKSSSVVMMKKGGSMEEPASWIPDPKTGYYRPENQDKQIDAVELREMLLKNKTSRRN